MHSLFCLSVFSLPPLLPLHVRRDGFGGGRGRQEDRLDEQDQGNVLRERKSTPRVVPSIFLAGREIAPFLIAKRACSNLTTAAVAIS